MIPDCHSESEDGWSEGDIGLTKNVSGRFEYLYLFVRNYFQIFI